MRIHQNGIVARPDAAVLYVDMNSFFASCEQQVQPSLRGRPIGVTAGDKYYAVIIAPSIEAKKFGVKTGMRLNEAKMLCPQLVGIPAHPVLYRKVHMTIMAVLRRFAAAEHVLAKSIDEAAVNFSTYRLVYKDMSALARQVKAELRAATGEFIKCSVGIAPNTFLAKLATDLQKPDGLVEITPDNIDGHLATLQLTDLPGIGTRNARRLDLMGIKTPLQMRHTSAALLRKVFGGVVGHYWHCRLHFIEVDFHSSDYRGMSATRTVSPEHRTPEKLHALLVSLCTKLEQRLVKARLYCGSATFFLRFSNDTSWNTRVPLGTPLQDATELRRHIEWCLEKFQTERRCGPLLNGSVKQQGIGITDFVAAEGVLYSLFDNRMRWDKLRPIVYGIKDAYGKYAVRKASEAVERSEMKDAIGFGSVKDLITGDGGYNGFMLEEVDE